MAVPTILDHYLQLEQGRKSFWSTLARRDDVTCGWMDTRSLSSLVTDSAAAGSAWGCGRHVWNGMINTLPDGTALRTLYSLLAEKKMKTGLVTTATITHATPASFAVTIDQRDKEADIAARYLERKVDVLMGGGNRFFAPDARPDRRDLYADFARAGYTVAKNRDEMRAARSAPLLGVFANGHIPYTVDRMHSRDLQQAVPTLREMTEKAIELLSGSEGGFVLQVEGARIDHAAHANDIGAAIFDQLAFEEACEAAIAFAEKDGQTLVVLTSDHGNSNPALFGSGPEYGDSRTSIQALSKMRASFEGMARELREANSASAVRDLVEAKLGIALSAEEAEVFWRARQGQSPLAPFRGYNFESGVLGMLLSNYHHVGWVSGQHTSDYTIVTAFGPGREEWAGLIDNVEVFDLLLAHRDIKFQNPGMSYEEGARHMRGGRSEALRSVVEAHWI